MRSRFTALLAAGIAMTGMVSALSAPAHAGKAHAKTAPAETAPAKAAPAEAGKGSDSIEKVVVPFSDVKPDVAAAAQPERILLCSARRAKNIDPVKNQEEADIEYDGPENFMLALGAGQTPYVAGKATENPAATPAASYRIMADLAGLFESVPPGFDRVADYWPKHVELGQTIRDTPAFVFILIDAIPDKKDQWSVYVSRAADAVSIDTTWIHRGVCMLKTDQAAEQKPAQPAG